MLPLEERVALIERVIRDAGLPDTVRVDSWGAGLLVDYCRQVGATVLVKGVRSQLDVTYETPMALVNRDLADVETVLLLPDPAHAHVSSSLVRQVEALGGDVAPYVPAAVAEALAVRRAG
jgi:pantetheine-phosphate adenylyltransferase